MWSSWWSGNWQEKPLYSEKIRPQCHVVRHKYHMTRPGVKHGLQRLVAVNNPLIYGTVTRFAPRTGYEAGILRTPPRGSFTFWGWHYTFICNVCSVMFMWRRNGSWVQSTSLISDSNNRQRLSPIPHSALDSTSRAGNVHVPKYTESTVVTKASLLFFSFMELVKNCG
jgi:hypothetical protein